MVRLPGRTPVLKDGKLYGHGGADDGYPASAEPDVQPRYSASTSASRSCVRVR